MNRKGFTIVELVIVIAVIAILAGVLIPTFSNVIEKANNSSALQIASSAFSAALAEVADKGFQGDVAMNDFQIKFTSNTDATIAYVGSDANLKRYTYEVDSSTGTVMIHPILSGS